VVKKGILWGVQKGYAFLGTSILLGIAGVIHLVLFNFGFAILFFALAILAYHKAMGGYIYKKVV
jgi:hypothetical protein